MSEKYDKNAIAAETTKNTPKISGVKNTVRIKLDTKATICITNVLEVNAKIPLIDLCVINAMSISSIIKVDIFPEK